MKINGKELRDILKKGYEKVKKYFETSDLQRKLDKEERKLQTSIELTKGLIEHWRQQILFYENSTLVNNSLIIQAEKDIKELEKDVKKVVKVINLYID